MPYETFTDPPPPAKLRSPETICTFFPGPNGGGGFGICGFLCQGISGGLGRTKESPYALLSLKGPYLEPQGTYIRDGEAESDPQVLDNAGSWGSGTHCPRRWRGQLQRQQGGSYPEGAELRAVGPGGGWNPSGAAGLRSPSAAGLGSCCWGESGGKRAAGVALVKQAGRLPAGV